MKQFTYTITEPVGIHARPAGLLVKAAKALDSTVTITKSDGSSAEAAKLFALMTLGVKQGDTITVSVEGSREDDDVEIMKKYFEENL